MQTYVFLDLDDDPADPAKCPAGGLIQPAYGPTASLSFTTDRQRASSTCSRRDGDPDDGPQPRRLPRVRLPFTDHAILNFKRGDLAAGRHRTRPGCDRPPRTRELGPELVSVLTGVQRFIATHNLGVNARLIADFDMPLYWC